MRSAMDRWWAVGHGSVIAHHAPGGIEAGQYSLEIGGRGRVEPHSLSAPDE